MLDILYPPEGEIGRPVQLQLAVSYPRSTVAFPLAVPVSPAKIGFFGLWQFESALTLGVILAASRNHASDCGTSICIISKMIKLIDYAENREEIALRWLLADGGRFSRLPDRLMPPPLGGRINFLG